MIFSIMCFGILVSFVHTYFQVRDIGVRDKNSIKICLLTLSRYNKTHRKSKPEKPKWA